MPPKLWSVEQRENIFIMIFLLPQLFELYYRVLPDIF